MEWGGYIHEETQVTSDLNHHFKGLDLSLCGRLGWVGLIVSGWDFFLPAVCSLDKHCYWGNTLMHICFQIFFCNSKFYIFCRHREVKIPALPKEQIIIKYRSRVERGMFITRASITNKCWKNTTFKHFACSLSTQASPYHGHGFFLFSQPLPLSCTLCRSVSSFFNCV